MTTSSVPFRQARAELAELCARVAYGGERIVLTRHGKPGAALVSIEDLARLGASVAAPMLEEVCLGMAADRSTVWRAIDFVRDRVKWWPELELQAYEGGELRHNYSRDIGRVLEAIPGTLLRMKWSDNCGDVEMRLEATDGGTLVTFAFATVGLDAKFWNERLEAMRAYVEVQS